MRSLLVALLALTLSSPAWAQTVGFPDRDWWWRDGPSAGGGSASVVSEPPGPQTPANPTYLTVTVISATRIDLAWIDSSSDELGFRVYRCEGLGPLGQCSPSGLLIELAAGVQAHSDTTVEPETAYTYTIKAFNAIGESGSSNTVGRITPSEASPPDAPTGLSAEAVSATQIDLTWTDNSDDETGFRIFRCTGASCPPTVELDTTAANATGYNDTSVSASTTYSYLVKAFNGAGESASSNVVEETTPSGATAFTGTPWLDWPMTEGTGLVAGDTSGSGHDGTIDTGTNSPQWVTDSEGTYLTFNGSGSNNQVFSVANITLTGAPAFTVEVVAKITSAAQNGSFFRIGSPSGHMIDGFYETDGRVVLRPRDGATNLARITAPASSAPTNGTWFLLTFRHAGGTVNNTNSAIFVNGVKTSPAEANTGAVNLAAEKFRASHAGQTWFVNPLTGAMAGIRFYEEDIGDAGAVSNCTAWQARLDARGIAISCP